MCYVKVRFLIYHAEDEENMLSKCLEKIGLLLADIIVISTAGEGGIFERVTKKCERIWAMQRKNREPGFFCHNLWGFSLKVSLIYVKIYFIYA